MRQSTPVARNHTIRVSSAGNVVARTGAVGKAWVICAIVVIVVLVVVLAGPVSSGAILLLLPSNQPRVEHDLPPTYVPFHKGHVDLATGLYIREDEDIVVPGTPALIVRRTYLSNYRVSKQFGIGTTHNGEWYLVGDGARFSWATLILADGAHVPFKRVSAGRSYMNALYANREESGEWTGAQLGWTGLWWTLRRQDGSIAHFRPCGVGSVCSLMRSSDADGHTIKYRRDRGGRLVKMDASADRWIAFEYDSSDRIVRAYSSTDVDMRYEYDVRGRLARVSSSDGTVRRYGYTDQDQMASVEDPDIAIENTYNVDGRCTRQVNRFPGHDGTLSFQFDYTLRDDRVVETSSTRSDGTWSRFGFDERRYATSETWGANGIKPATITYERDPTGSETALTVTCPDRLGQPLPHRSLVRPGTEESVKWDLLQTHCSWRSRP
jgi:YD repeat-containing protein